MGFFLFVIEHFFFCYSAITYFPMCFFVYQCAIKKVEEHDVLPPFVIIELYDDYSSQFSAALRK